MKTTNSEEMFYILRENKLADIRGARKDSTVLAFVRERDWREGHTRKINNRCRHLLKGEERKGSLSKLKTIRMLKTIPMYSYTRTFMQHSMRPPSLRCSVMRCYGICSLHIEVL